uniref:methyltransferase-like protein 22 isoform X1 n=1 Tax=Solea senegalensis TaxID=28829 RepID=UPI001CD91382|nr:methyltransferase-like protein 22 isoform X1 [Solea senegalensis]XP_043907688.1 methyltransferase-like protein 22 isoform X1 [Solea senegalensis]XP_043907689.1 methyltransferase-like protein 22 isoform X1 [Solea senegalensis]
MDHITFHYDTVLSDVHMLLSKPRHLMTRLNHVGQPVFISNFKILSDVERLDSSGSGKRSAEQKSVSSREDCEKDSSPTQEKDGEEGNEEPCLDEDGDLDITRRRRFRGEDGGRDLVCPIILKQSSPGLEHEVESPDDEDKCTKDIIKIEHTMATPLQDVGKQVWRGAFLLADFILSESDLFRGATVLELGAGTGFTSIVMATTAKTVYCTDVGEDLLSMCERNVSFNRRMTELTGGEVRVRLLDWLQHSLCTAEADVDFSWTEEEVADVYDNTLFIIAADVIYDDELTSGLFRTLHGLCSNFNHTCTIFISIEKRMNFTLRHMDVCCEAYTYFRRCLSQLQDLDDGRCSFRVEQLPCDFAQFFIYERIEQLELWKVTATPRLSDEVCSNPELKPSPGLSREQLNTNP